MALHSRVAVGMVLEARVPQTASVQNMDTARTPIESPQKTKPLSDADDCSLTAPVSCIDLSIIFLSPPRMRSGSMLSFSIFLVLMSSSVSSRIFAGLKLGGNERGGNSLNVATNLNTSSITPYMLPTWLSCQSQKVLEVMSARSNGSCIQVEDLLQAQLGEWLRPHPHRAFLALLREDVLVVALPHGDEQAVVVGVEELVARAFHAVVVAAVPLTVRRNSDWS